MIYLVTLVKDEFLRETRCPGYFNTLQDAELAIIHNDYDIHEESYQYAIIEELPEGLYQSCKQIWYIWKNNCYQLAQENEIPMIVKKLHGSLVIN